MGHSFRTAIISLLVLLISEVSISQDRQREQYYPPNINLVVRNGEPYNGGEGVVKALTSERTVIEYRQRVWETISNLPLSADWRYEDARDKFFEKWKAGIYNTLVIYTDKDTILGESPGRYIPPDVKLVTSNGSTVWVETELGKIHLNPDKFKAADNNQKVLEHELYHAAFRSDVYIPGWMLYLGNKTDIGEPYNGVERVAMALTSRRSVIDYHKLPLNSFLTLQQIDDYVTSRLLVGLDTGFQILIKTTTPENLVKFLNFVNGYELDCGDTGVEL